MNNPAWINSEYCNLSEAQVSLEDRGYLFGDGIYEVIRVYNKTPFFLQAHLDRLHRSAAAIRLDLPYSDRQLRTVIDELIRRSGYGDAYIYMQVTRGKAVRDHLFPIQTEPVTAIYIRELAPQPELDHITPATCITLPDERWMNCHIKTTNLLPNLLARQQAHEAGAMEAILCRPGGLVTEGTRSNLFAMIDGLVRTHPCNNLILPGISREIVLDLLMKNNVHVAEKAFSTAELKRASEVWLTSTSQEVKPVGKIDDYLPSGLVPGPVTLKLMEEFRRLIDQNCRGGA